MVRVRVRVWGWLRFGVRFRVTVLCQGKFRVRVRIWVRVWVRIVNMFGVMVMVRVNTTQNFNPYP